MLHFDEFEQEEQTGEKLCINEDVLLLLVISSCRASSNMSLGSDQKTLAARDYKVEGPRQSLLLSHLSPSTRREKSLKKFFVFLEDAVSCA